MAAPLETSLFVGISSRSAGGKRLSEAFMARVAPERNLFGGDAR
jgi:hypothetical protein